MLPIRKRDVVRAKFGSVLLFEMTAFLLNALLTAFRMAFWGDAEVYVQNAMMNANFAYLGYLLMIFAAFNGCFPAGFFKTAYNIGKPFLAFAIISFLIVAAGETLHHIPGLEPLNRPDATGIGIQAVVLGAGILVFCFGTYLAFRLSAKRFEGIDL